MSRFDIAMEVVSDYNYFGRIAVSDCIFEKLDVWFYFMTLKGSDSAAKNLINAKLILHLEHLCICYSTWLGRWFLFQTFDDESKINVQEICELLDEKDQR